MNEQTDAKLDLLERHRIRAVELPGRVLEPDGKEDADAYREGLSVAAERLPTVGVELVSVHLPFWPADISSLDADERAFALAAIERSLRAYGEFFPTGVAVVHPGEIILDDAAEADRLQQSIESLSRVAEVAAEVGSRLAVLNMPPGSVSFPGRSRVGQDIDFLLRAVDEIAAEHVGICLDTAHANVSGDVCEMARKCGRKLFHMHLGDNSGEASVYSHLRNRLVPGEGTVPWGALGDILYQIGFAGAAVLEVGPTDERSYDEIIEDTRARLVDWVWFA